MRKIHSKDNSWCRRKGQRGFKLSLAFNHSSCDPDPAAKQRFFHLISRRGRIRCFRFSYLALALALILALTSPAFADGGASTMPGDTGPLIKALRTLAKVVVDTLIAIAAILMVVGVATGFVAGQLLTTLGAPYGASTAMLRVVSVVLLAIGAFLTTVIANAVIDAVGGMVPATEIRVPIPGGGDSGYLDHLLPVVHTWVKSLLV